MPAAHIAITRSDRERVPIMKVAFEVEKVALEEMDFKRFYENYFVTEIPIILTGVANHWRARKEWTAESLQKKIEESSAAFKNRLWYESSEDFLKDEYATPEIVSRTFAETHSVRRKTFCRFWVNEKGNVTNWHYDGNGLYVFNVQVKGCKQWTIISPQTPLASYPFGHRSLPFSFRKPDGNMIYAQFKLEEGEMIFLPPFWQHHVIALDETNINFNWVGTKKTVPVDSEALKREREILSLAKWVVRFKLTRHLFGRADNFLNTVYVNTFAGIGFPLIEDLTRGVSPQAVFRRTAREAATMIRLMITWKNGHNMWRSKPLEFGTLDEAVNKR
jgi:hypothetical protein